MPSITSLLKLVTDEDLSIPGMVKECRKAVNTLRDLRESTCTQETGVQILEETP